MSPESVILLAVSAWLLVAAAMLWGMLRVARRHTPLQTPTQAAAAAPSKRKPVRSRRQRPALSPAYRAAHHFLTR